MQSTTIGGRMLDGAGLYGNASGKGDGFAFAV